MKWVWAAGKRLPGLVRRRKAEVLAYASEALADTPAIDFSLLNA